MFSLTPADGPAVAVSLEGGRLLPGLLDLLGEVDIAAVLCDVPVDAAVRAGGGEAGGDDVLVVDAETDGLAQERPEQLAAGLIPGRAVASQVEHQPQFLRQLLPARAAGIFCRWASRASLLLLPLVQLCDDGVDLLVDVRQRAVAQCVAGDGDVARGVPIGFAGDGGVGYLELAVNLTALAVADDPDAGAGRRHLRVAGAALDQGTGPLVKLSGFRVPAVVDVEGSQARAQQAEADAVELGSGSRSGLVAAPRRRGVGQSLLAVFLVGHLGPLALDDLVPPEDPVGHLGQGGERRREAIWPWTSSRSRARISCSSLFEPFSTPGVPSAGASALASASA